MNKVQVTTTCLPSIQYFGEPAGNQVARVHYRTFYSQAKGRWSNNFKLEPIEI